MVASLDTGSSSGTPATTWTASKVRGTFIEYFREKHAHTFVPSSSTIPHDDPTLLFANAGMNQYKPIFLGTVDPQSDFGKLKRAVNSQKCIRGKHNDLDDVGKDVYHHTFFEMLGNWSFGDYFKKEIISWSWDLLTNVYGIDADRLYVTYFGGDEKSGLAPDNEARDLWLAVGVPAERILPFGTKDNFWEMGDQGPCGPCSEIHYDRIGNRDASALVNLDDPMVLEIWNIVFIQYNREADGSLRQLPSRHIDTGMGLERVVSVLQDKPSNYDTDVFQGIFANIRRVTNGPAYQGRVGADDVDGVDMAYRVVADHVRTLTFAISDGGVPSNEGRGYVLRRILRRGVRYARRRFNVQIGKFFSSLVDTVVEEMGEAFPEIVARKDEVKAILDEEEEAFSRTLDRGERLFDSYLHKTLQSGSKQLDGADVWRLYDTYGFPVDLTRLMAEENGLSVDEDGFQREQTKAKELSRSKRTTGAGGDQVALDVHAIGELEKNEAVPKTDDKYKYETGHITATIKALYDGHAFVDEITTPQTMVGILLDRSNFYAEQGGQEYDMGTLVIDGKTEFAVENVQVYAGYVLHIGYLKYGKLALGEQVVCAYDEARRWPLRNNHTATHILNYALRKVLGDIVDQKGSLVAPEKLRFDYTCKVGRRRMIHGWDANDRCHNALTVEQLTKVEAICNEFIRRDMAVHTKDVPLSVAKAIHGLRAVFGEVYPDPVRVVSIGVDVNDLVDDVSRPEWAETSIEFCGGTHVAKTGDMKEFVIMEESAIAKGIRRIVAVTGEEAHQASQRAVAYEKQLNELRKLSGAQLDAALKTTSKELDVLAVSAIAKASLRGIFNEIKREFTEAEKTRKAAEIGQAVDAVKAYIEQSPDASVIVQRLHVGNNTKAVLAAIQHVKTANKAAYFFSVDEEAGRVGHQCFDMIARGLKASEWAQAVSEKVGGKKGGKDETAQGSGDRVEAVDEALALAEAFATLKLQA
ncbi:alanyl-tRNA synthetase, cytoplasmic [Syncephalis pseudoplumigaleata]|uniref:Alanine--tRNA ligase n=1 Tax=Syncephalis pseudoplumigaleata TaxID=1712513 RepID=A0A4P9Z1S0_9FUNG|nr:alanyl-tRNA synthetase, cytoplasmic [Syncephalis pseudoplumigaleata]|eukprot:RKP26288.1 alanyl-tRNA synthetase, cytoplasmic [Syncephalis pseudoplumigaleata]